MVPLMVVSAISFAINKHIRGYSIYTKKFLKPQSGITEDW
jgi:hypothetical protein